MKTRTIVTAGTAVLSVLFGISVTGYAGQQHPEERQSQPQQQRQAQSQQRQSQPQQQRQAQSQQRQSQPQQQRQAQNRQQQDRGQQQRQSQPQQRQAQNQQQQRAQQGRNDNSNQRNPEQRRFEQSTWQQHRAGNWQSDHRTWQQRGGYNGYRIPDDRYRGYFGQGHGFRIGGLPFLVVGGYPRFQYNGYWFSMVDPYPGYWGADWYDTDDVYVDYVDNGYYLYNRRYPGVGVAISISM